VGVAKRSLTNCGDASDAGDLESGRVQPIAPSEYAPGRKADEPRTCRSCSTVTHRGMKCRKCGRFLLANQLRRKDGSRAVYQPPDVLMPLDELLAAIVSDLGGPDTMSALKRSLAGKIRDVDVLLTLNKNQIVKWGLDTPQGRKAHDRYLTALDRFLRLAAQLGLEREAKRIDLARALSGLR
jgi:hypothetical protein